MIIAGGTCASSLSSQKKAPAPRPRLRSHGWDRVSSFGDTARTLLVCRNRRVTSETAPPKSPSTRITHQEVFEHELALATVKWPAALTTGKLLVRQTLIGFNTHELVLGAAVRAIERRCSGNRHEVVGFEAGQSTSVSSVRQTLAGKCRDPTELGPSSARDLGFPGPPPTFKSPLKARALAMTTQSVVKGWKFLVP